MAPVSRRRFVQVGLGGALVLGAAGGLLRWVSSGYALRPGEVALGLSDKQLVVVRAIVDALVPGEDGLPSGVELGIHQRVDEQVWAADAALQRDLRGALELIEHLPPLLGYAGRFSSLEADARRRAYGELLRSKRDLFVQIASGYKQMVHLLYYAHEAVWPHIGYDGPWIQTPRPPESALAYAELLRRRGGTT